MHNVIQYRTAQLTLYSYSTIDKAKQMLTEIENQVRSAVSSGLLCVMCKVPVTAPPYWCCLECKEVTVICYACNERVERDKEWLLERRPKQNREYNWSHTLVSAPNPELNTVEMREVLTIEERVARLEAQLSAQSATLEKILEILKDRS
ncbi:hypothetical protein L226DRAFT_575427 [Lentinus tigrinus ALCF2SS1-7]|uniref:Uncharacterized protein n=1 Tax=Lentinus tigrinus ALCF2SS1-6 TaxID=1328759 RepID=A0A5C2RV37_9APHY|nr:hypothetical protein L227DRAFT_657625 [Lentinus tigrinus ALCF2SS1-6]RPD69597.1 hypothetical protein L226DRAFT_575427 [Lentinus tigrinus ALCF2SS1-7]